MSSLVGSFLVACPGLLTPSFKQTVVLVLKQGVKGAFGVVVNRPLEENDRPYPVFFGGPCAAAGFLILHGHPEWVAVDSSAPEIAPGIFLGDFGCLKRFTEGAAGEELRCRLLSGYACWRPGQLEAELEAGIWSVAPAEAGALFEVQPANLWSLLAPPKFPRPSQN